MKDMPAFPVNSDNYANTESTGMTLRDYFAAKAMQALLGSAEWRSGLPDIDGDGIDASEFTASVAYSMADSMLEARS